MAIVTGSNSGIGYETARALAHKRANVVMACRNLDKAQTAADQIRQDVNKANLEIIQLDLADQASIRKFAQTFKTQHTGTAPCYDVTLFI